MTHSCLVRTVLMNKSDCLYLEKKHQMLKMSLFSLLNE